VWGYTFTAAALWSQTLKISKLIHQYLMSLRGEFCGIKNQEFQNKNVQHLTTDQKSLHKTTFLLLKKIRNMISVQLLRLRTRKLSIRTDN
jgi:hypothetical protein